MNDHRRDWLVGRLLFAAMIMPHPAALAADLARTGIARAVDSEQVVRVKERRTHPLLEATFLPFPARSIIALFAASPTAGAVG